MLTRHLRRRSHWPFNRHWCVRIEQLVEQCELHLHDNRCKIVYVYNRLCLLNKASKSQTFKDFNESVPRLDKEFN